MSIVSHWPAPIDTDGGCIDQRPLNTCNLSETEVFSLDIFYKESLNSKDVPISCSSTGRCNSGHNFLIGLIPVSQL